MFNERSLLYFKDYKFSDGTSKPKYFLVFREYENGQLLLMSLPTSIRKLPIDIPDDHGCVSTENGVICTYIIHTNNSICENGFKFPKMTYLIAEQIAAANIEILSATYTAGDYELKGKVTRKEFNSIIQCVIKSRNLKGKFKNLLNEIQ